MHSSGIKNGEYIAGCRPCICNKPTDLQTPTPNEWEKIGLYNPFLAADTQKMLAQQAITPNNG